MEKRIINHCTSVRKLAGISAGNMAAIVGCSRETLRRVESGKNLPSVVLAIRIATALDTTVNALWEEVGGE